MNEELKADSETPQTPTPSDQADGAAGETAEQPAGDIVDPLTESTE